MSISPMSDSSTGDQCGQSKQQSACVSAQSPTSVHASEDGRSQTKHYNPFASCLGRRKWHDDRYEHFVSPSVEDYPTGYPCLAARVNSDIDTLLFRRFGWLRCRALLHLQDDLQVLEKSLLDMDRRHHFDGSQRLVSKRWDEAFHDEGTTFTRRSMMEEINSKLREYDDLLARQHVVSSYLRPGNREFRAYFDWLYNDPPVAKEELEFIYRKDDFLALGQQADSWLGPLVDNISQLLPDALLKLILTSHETRSKTRNPNSIYYSNERWDILIKVLVNLAAIILLILPTALLYILNISRGSRLAILVVFVVFFNCALAGLTGAKRHEVFAATAAYCAVLVVFLGSIS